MEDMDKRTSCKAQQELLDGIFLLLQELRRIVDKHFSESGAQTKKQVENLWLQNLVIYAEECCSSAVNGSYFSLAIVLRTLIEKYVAAYYIKKDKNDLLWKRWLVQTHMLAVYSLNKEMDPSLREPHWEAICQKYGFPYEKALCERFIHEEREWLRPAVGEKSQLTIAELSKPMGSKIMEDYRKLCGYSYSSTLSPKSPPAVIDQSILFLLCVLLDYIADAADLFIPRHYSTSRYRVLLFSAYQRFEAYANERSTFPGIWSGVFPPP